MQAVVGEDALHTAQTDGEVGLAQLLGDDLRGRGWIQKAIAQDLADDRVRAAVMGFGPGLFGLEGRQAAPPEGVQELVITLAAIAVLGGEGGDVGVPTLPLDPEKEAAGDLVGGGDQERAGGADELMGHRVEMQGRLHGKKIAARASNV